MWWRCCRARVLAVSRTSFIFKFSMLFVCMGFALVIVVINLVIVEVFLMSSVERRVNWWRVSPLVMPVMQAFGWQDVMSMCFLWIVW